MYSNSYKLKHPYSFGSQSVSEVFFRRPKAKDLKGVNLGDMKFDDFLLILSNICKDLTQPVIEEMDFEDITHLVQEVQRFLANGQETGES